MQLTRLTLLCLMLLSSAAMAAQQPPQESSADADREIVMAPIELDGDELFRVRGVSSFPAEARAAGIRRRIIAVARDPSIPIDSLRIVERPGAAVIMAADRMVMTIVEGDASLEDVTRSDLARAHLVRVQEAIAEYRAARTASALQRAALNTLIVTVILAISIALLVRVWRWLDGLLGRQMEARIHSVGIQSFELMRAERIRAAVRSALAMVRALVLLACGIVYVGYVLGEWPWTRGMSRNVIAFALSPLQVIGTSIVANIPSLVFLAVLFFVVRLSLRLIRLFFEAVERGTVTLHGFDPEWAQPTYKIVRIAVLAFGIVVAYPYIPGSGSAAFKGVSLFIGIVVSLGSSSALSNIIAGYMMTYRRAFRVGDRVKIGETIGDVIEMRLQVTHLRSLKNEEIVIPNSQILANEVLNYSSLARLHGLILHTEVGIGYETPWRQIEAMLLAASARTPGLLREPAPFVLLKKLGDFAVTYELNVYCGNVSGMMALYTALHRNVLDVFNEYGVQIMTPAYEGDPAEPKVVAPRDFYTAPAAMPEPAPRVSAATKESGVIG